MESEWVPCGRIMMEANMNFDQVAKAIVTAKKQGKCSCVF